MYLANKDGVYEAIVYNRFHGKTALTMADDGFMDILHGRLILPLKLDFSNANCFPTLPVSSYAVCYFPL